MRRKLGTVRIAPGVLATIAQLTTLSVDGVARMGYDPTTRIRRILGSGNALRGVRIDVAEDSVAVDLHIVAQPGVSLLDLGREVQAAVTRAIHDIVGMAVRQVDVHIQDVVNRQGS